MSFALFAPRAITEVVIEEDSVHISSIIAAPLLLYCDRQVLEVRCNGRVLPWNTMLNGVC